MGWLDLFGAPASVCFSVAQEKKEVSLFRRCSGEKMVQRTSCSGVAR
jgi:hypothetical protein